MRYVRSSAPYACAYTLSCCEVNTRTRTAKPVPEKREVRWRPQNCEGFSRHVFASLEIAAARFAREFVPDAPTFEALWSRIDVRGVVPPADAARFVTMWLGDGTKRRLEVTVATEEEPLIGGFLATLAERCGYELSVNEYEDEEKSVHLIDLCVTMELSALNRLLKFHFSVKSYG